MILYKVVDFLIKHPESLIGEKNLKGKTKQAKLIKL